MTNLKEFPLANGWVLFVTWFRDDQKEEYPKTLHTGKNTYIHTYTPAYLPNYSDTSANEWHC
jgi:hypothetical protein